MILILSSPLPYLLTYLPPTYFLTYLLTDIITYLRSHYLNVLSPGWGLSEPVQYHFPEFPHYETRKNEALFREYVKVGLGERTLTAEREWIFY